MKKNLIGLLALVFVFVSCGSDDDDPIDKDPIDDGTGTPSWTTYEVLDTKAELGFYMLDRNVGATEKYNGDSRNPNAASIGYYYQFGKNAPVAGSDQKLNSNYDKEWNASGDSFKDWTKSDNSPCPKGWRVPTKAEAKLIVDKAWADYDWGTQTDDEFEAAKALYKKIAIPRSFCLIIKGEDAATRATATSELYPSSGKAGYLWSAALSEETVTESTRSFKYAYTISDNNDILFGKKGTENEVNVAMPIRCVKTDK